MYTLMDKIVYHHKDETMVTNKEGHNEESNIRRRTNITTKGQSFLVNWKDGMKYWISLKDIK